MKLLLSVKQQEASAAPVAQPRGALPAPPAPGLVSLQTSDTPLGLGEEFEVDQVGARKKRLGRTVRQVAGLHQFTLGPKCYKPAMVTLTYADVDGFQPRHISVLLKHIRQWLARRNHRFHYVWVAELQARGALHYHIIVWLPKGLTLPKPDKQGWWSHGMTQIKWATHAVGYLCKYVSKFDGVATFPRGLRLHGSGGHGDIAKRVRRWSNLPGWLRSLVGVESRVVRRKGLGLVDLTSGTLWQTPWAVRVQRRRVFIRKLFEYADSLMDVAGPYSELAHHYGCGR